VVGRVVLAPLKGGVLDQSKPKMGENFKRIKARKTKGINSSFRGHQGGV